MEVLSNPQFQEISLAIRIIFLIVALFLLFLIVFFLRRSSFLQFFILQDLVEFFTFKPYGTRKIVKRWGKIKTRFELPSESEQKLAIIEAEGILDEILKKMGFSGATFEERLKQMTSVQLSNIEEIWEAHKIRNNIVHDPDYRLSPVESRKAFEIYERALTNLEAF